MHELSPSHFCRSLCGCSTVTDLSVGQVNMLGVAIAGISVVSSGMQQIMCGQIQRKHKLTSMQMLSNTAPVQVRACKARLSCVCVHMRAFAVCRSGLWILGRHHQH